MARGAWRRGGILAFLGLCGACYEIPPAIPPGHVGSPAAPGWPPLAVYDAEPLHPRNRWFHRAFSARGPAGEVLPAHADEPWGLLARPSAVDGAEILALLERIAAEPAPEKGAPDSARAAVSRAIFAADLVAEASRLLALAETEAARRIAALSRRIAERSALESLERSGPPPEVIPPPLRGGKWVEEAPPAEQGLLPSPFDPRWTRFLREEGPPGKAVLLRLRVAPGEEGKPLLLPLPGECWEIDGNGSGNWNEEGGGDDPVCRVWRFDRAEWLQGREPWRLTSREEEISIRDPRDPSRALSGAAGRLCGSCHSSDRAGGSARRASEPQESLVKAALAKILE